LRRDGSFAYLPPAGFTGTDTFSFIARDDEGHVSAVAHASIAVTAGGPPVATADSISPAEGTAVRGPVAITATLTPPSGQTISSWKVSYHVPGDPNRVQLASGSGPNVSANFDPTLVRDGTYEINIHSQVSGGGVAETESGLIVEGDYKPGLYATTFDDMKVDAANIPIDIQRTYDSTNKTTGDFGIGWSADIVNFRVDTNGPLGRGGWSGTQCGFLGSQVCFSSTRKHIVTVTRPDGHVEKFDLTPTPASNIGSNLTTSAYTAEPGTSSTLTANDIGMSRHGSDFDEGDFFADLGIYDPAQFTLTTKDGTQYFLDRRLGLLGVKDSNGNTLTIDSTGILSSSGPSVTFTRDGQDRITQISGPTGNIDYTYSPAGDLIGVHYPNGVVQAFTYDTNHDLLTTSGGGQVLRTLHYDASGRLTAVTDGNGHTATISSNVAGHQNVVTDATGQLTTVNTYDDFGDLIQQDRTAGGKTITTKATFDANGRQLSSTDGLGHTSSQTLDAAGNVLTQTDGNGQTTTYTYNSFGERLTIKDPLGHVTTNKYDAKGNLTETDAPDGGKTTDTYDGAGHLLTTTDPDGRVQTRTYDSHGQLATSTDLGGNTTPSDRRCQHRKAEVGHGSDRRDHDVRLRRRRQHDEHHRRERPHPHRHVRRVRPSHLADRCRRSDRPRYIRRGRQPLVGPRSQRPDDHPQLRRRLAPHQQDRSWRGHDHLHLRRVRAPHRRGEQRGPPHVHL
jgi:YD repeat-containing protein